MNQRGHNRPPIVIELTPDQAEFLIKNCDANLRLGLQWLQLQINDEKSDRPGAEKMVAMIEEFRELKKLVDQAQKDAN